MAKQLPHNTRNALTHLGSSIRTARIKRRLTLAEMAAHMGTSVPTLRRLEQGDGGVSTANLALAMRALGELDRLKSLIDPGTDATGLKMDLGRLPRRVRHAGARRRESPASNEEAPTARPTSRGGEGLEGAAS
jgi:transcriptional regulator with XRE-family HTH domain